MTSSVEVRVGAATNVGMREHNEDSYLAQMPVFIVADGMGGHMRGDVASGIVVDTFRPLVGRGFVSGDSLDLAIKDAGGAIAALGGGVDGLAPGSTLTGFVISDLGGMPCARVFNIGDSRTYHLSGTGFSQVTKDHSEVQEMVEAGELTALEARTASNRNVITRAIGGASGIDVGADVFLLPVRSGDRFVICSDGLSGEVTDALIGSIARLTVDAQETAEVLVQSALGAGGRDNVTVVVVDIVTTSPIWADSRIDGITSSGGQRRTIDDTLPRDSK